MDFTMNMMESARAIPVSQTASVVGSMAGYQTHQPTHTVSVNSTQQQQSSHQHQAAVAAAAAAVQQSHARAAASLHDEASALTEAKLQDLTKDDSEGTFTPPPPRGNAVDSRVEKGTDTTDFEPAIKIEIRGSLPGLNLGSEKERGNVIQLHFNTPAEVLHYFSQRSAVPQLDAFNLLANPDLMRNINPELVRNHFLYVPSAQENVRVTSNGFAGASSTQTQPAAAPSPLMASAVVGTAPCGSGASAGGGGGVVGGMMKTVKQERRRGEVPPGTIIHRNVPLEALPNQFVCWVCGMDLQKALPFEEHMVEQHSVEKPYKCDDCGVTFKRKAHLDRHRRIHLPTRPYECGVCGKGFTRNEHVRRHAFTHSGLTTTLLLQTTDASGRIVTINQGPVPTSAAQSAIATSSVNAVTTQPVTAAVQVAHATYHSVSTGGGGGGGGGTRVRTGPNGEPVARPYQCGVCSKAFIRNEHLRRHVLTHNGEKPHACSLCAKAFSRREHLTKHLRSHSPKVSTLPSGVGLLQSGQHVANSHSAQHQLQSSSVGVSAAHAAVQNTPAVVSLVTPGSNAGSTSAAAAVAAAALGGSAGPSTTHGITTSHGTPVTHLPPGTHYLPMFNLLAEVV